MRTDHKLNGWPTPPGRAPGASMAPAASLDDRRNNDNSEPGHAFRVHAENGWVVVELPGYPPFPEERTARVLREQLHRLVDSRPVQLQLDLGRVHHAFSFFVTTLVSLHRRIRDMGGRLVLRDVDPHLQHTIHACKLDSILEGCSDYGVPGTPYLTAWANSGKSRRATGEQALRPMCIRQARLEPLARSASGHERTVNG